MKKRNAFTLAVLATACAASVFAAPAKEGVKDPESGITLYPPKHDTNVATSAKQKKLADEAKAAMQRVATATKKVVHSADQAIRDAMRNDKT